MDARTRQLEHNYFTTPTLEAALLLANTYQRAGRANELLASSVRDTLLEGGVSLREIPRVILYAATDYGLQHQPVLDFRTLLHRDLQGNVPYGELYDNFDSIRFGGGVRFSIQAGSRHYSSPRETLADHYGYTAWEGRIGSDDGWLQPERVENVWDMNDPKPEEWDEDAVEDWNKTQDEIAAAERDPLATVDREWKQIIWVHPDVTAGGIFYGIPHLDQFSTPDKGVLPFVDTRKIQDLFDFLRARFGLQQPAASRHYRANPTWKRMRMRKARDIRKATGLPMNRCLTIARHLLRGDSYGLENKPEIARYMTYERRCMDPQCNCKDFRIITGPRGSIQLPIWASYTWEPVPEWWEPER